MIDWEDLNFPPINLWNNPYQDIQGQSLQVNINSLGEYKQ